MMKAKKSSSRRERERSGKKFLKGYDRNGRAVTRIPANSSYAPVVSRSLYVPAVSTSLYRTHGEFQRK